MAFILHHAIINAEGQEVGVHITFYVDWVNALIKSHDPQEFITQAFVIQQHGDRSLVLILLYTIVELTCFDN